MDDDLEARHLDMRHLTANIVAAYVSNNHVQVSELPKLLAGVHAAVQAAAQGHAAAPAVTGGPVEKLSATEIRRSVGRDALISFEDGKPYKTLRRHLTLRGLTPEAYRAKWGLPVDYPLVSATYSARRSDISRQIGVTQRLRMKVAAE